MVGYFSQVLPILLTVSAVQATDCTLEYFSALLASSEDATVNYAVAVTEGSSFGVPSLAFPDNATDLPALCAVGINVKSSANSSYNFGLFLPDSIWNERFLATGNGGYGGGINWPDMGIFSHYGFATMSTDTGHNASAVGDGSWGLNAPESLIDWGYRAMHGSVELSKSIVNTYYSISDGIQYSYYASCSTGGRQGLREVQLYPEDFDGISIGAPAWWSTHLASATLKQGLYNYPTDSPKHIDSTLFPTIVAEMEKQCDPQDGVVDGIVSDPFACNFNFEALLCTSGNGSACLTPSQLQTVYDFYNDFVDVNQTFVFPGVTLGTDPSFLLGNLVPLGYGYYQNWVYNDTTWDFTQLTYADIEKADAIDPGNATADDFDLTPYMNRGGKIIMYHGAADSLIPTGSSKVFYNKVTETLAPKGVNLDDFYRLFLIPGMSHCSGSAIAPWYIAGGSQALTGVTHSVPSYEDADHDVILAMMKWVEEDSAPEELIATKFVNDTASLGVQSQRPLCVYPKQAKYAGSGNFSLPENWECKSLY
ncbi:feruloyl esterase B precursor [Xylariales sp. AK1849]|nr:feruloyl esterase B precursor [Xylariales sp. AK1849]